MLTNFNKMLFYMKTAFHIVSMHFYRTDNKNKGVMLGISNEKDADVYYSAMDCQKNPPEGHCEGCYYALNRLTLGNNEFQHNFIGQAFFSGRHSCEETSYFSIRKTRDGILYTIDSLFRICGSLSVQGLSLLFFQRFFCFRF